MSLMISVSGIRGIVGTSLTPENLTTFALAFASWIRSKREPSELIGSPKRPRIVIGRDTRPTGFCISNLVSNALALSGCDVIDIGIATTPTVELATVTEGADGGLIVTASHNPVEWNALKMLNSRGEFLSAPDVDELLAIVEKAHFHAARWDDIGTVTTTSRHDDLHIDKIMNLPFIDPEAIRKQEFRVMIDCVEGAGFSIVPRLCRMLGMEALTLVACEGSGLFPRNPEPVEENLAGTITAMKQAGCDFGLIVDPDVDRLALICEDGSLFGEEYTLVACADFFLNIKNGPVANNLSSSRALADIARQHGVACYSAKVGEANVIELMKKVGAVIGGEGNGGVILPDLHYGRDALVGIALFVQAFTAWRMKNQGGTISSFRREFPEYVMSKQKIKLGSMSPEILDNIFNEISLHYPLAKTNITDGLKLDFDDCWVHLRPSNTEPIVRIYAEAHTKTRAEEIALELMNELKKAERR
ncbi:MAG: phosphoglucosamine mutase [Chlorobiaceae bacterium]|jgi:phosphomannomutase|nr:phosphoglucosamine mutase [Chlorobiaceae bacterium]NTW62987.1 phosphoglucosamine mutase [Chlorobiaceae bacterium]